MTETEDGETPRVGASIRDARTARGMSLRELARRIDVSPATVSAIETGKTRVDVNRLHAIAVAIDTTAADLVSHHRGGTPMPTVHSGSNWRSFGSLPDDPVLRAAVDVFVEKGYHGSTIRAVAARAKMSVPGVYHHYPSKQDLLVTCFDVTMNELLWRVPAARDEGGTPAERIALVVESLALFHTHRRKLALIGASEMRSLEPANRRRIAGLRTRIQRVLDDEIAAALADGTVTTSSPRNAARAISTMCTSLAQWFRTGGPSTPEQIAADYARFALALLGGQRVDA